jgi:hypothetical protein
MTFGLPWMPFYFGHLCRYLRQAGELNGQLQR